MLKNYRTVYLEKQASHKKYLLELMKIWEDGIRGEAATDAAKDVSSAISIRVMQSVELIPIQSLEMTIFTD